MYTNTSDQHNVFKIFRSTSLILNFLGASQHQQLSGDCESQLYLQVEPDITQADAHLCEEGGEHQFDELSVFDLYSYEVVEW